MIIALQSEGVRFGVGGDYIASKVSAKIIICINVRCRRATSPLYIRTCYVSLGRRTPTPVRIVPIIAVELTVIIQFSIHSDSLGSGPSWDGIGYGVLPVSFVCHRKRPIYASAVHVQNPGVAAA